jgi:hypothetical protein
MLVLDTIFDSLQRKAKVTWVRDEPTQGDIDHILAQGTPSDFDPNGLRAQTLDDLSKGRARLVTKRCEFGKILAVVYPNTIIPWDMFGRILSCVCVSLPKKPWRIVWLANPAKRVFPGGIPGPADINGGYTYQCTSDTIVIFREEEVLRVLIHELLHAACTDNPNHSDPLREVLTETWAELFLVCIVAKSKAHAHRLWTLQAQWIVKQEALLAHSVKGPEDYAWRYTVGRRQVLEGWGIALPSPSEGAGTLSLRFTSPLISNP